MSFASVGGLVAVAVRLVSVALVLLFELLVAAAVIGVFVVLDSAVCIVLESFNRFNSFDPSTFDSYNVV